VSPTPPGNRLRDATPRRARLARGSSRTDGNAIREKNDCARVSARERIATNASRVARVTEFRLDN
jgi:hypothetical protein